MARQISEEVTVITQFHLSPKRRTGERLAHLVVLGGHNVGQVHNLDRTDTLIGRDERADIQIMDAGISRRHALIVRTSDGAYEIRDMGSRNGTFANNHRVDGSRTLEDGDKIQLGAMSVLRFAYADEAESDYAQKMYEKAHRDGLTGVFNRRYFEDRLSAEFAHAARHNRPLALLMMDLDHFKKVNDTHGHPVGDTVLKEFADLLQRTTRGEDAVIRYGGEEFAILCRHTDMMKASILGERIRHEVSAAVFASDGPKLQITVSIGIAAAPDPSITSADTMVQAADEALYKAKQRGRNCVVTRRKRR
jgi:diguanylate cyclase (GGDEF)-like protein